MSFLLVPELNWQRDVGEKVAYSGSAMPSSVIRGFRYLAHEHQLEIVFVSGRRYRYLEVPAKTYAAMREAFSKGEFFNEQIRDRFAFVRLEDVRIAS